MEMKHDFFDVYYQPGENPVFCYRSGLAVYEEALIGGAFVSQGWNAAGYTLNVLPGFPTRIDVKKFTEPFAFNLEVNGICVDYNLKFVDFSTEKSEKELHAVLVLESEIAPVRIKVHTLLDGTAMFARWLEIENLSEGPLNVSRLNPLAGGLEVMQRGQMTDSDQLDKFYSVGYFEDDHWGREGHFVWQDLRPEVHAIDTRFNRDRYRHPLMFIRNNVMGTMWFVQMAYSGGCRFTLDYNAQRELDASTLAFKAEVTGYKPLIILGAKEVLQSPEVHIGVVNGDLDMAVNEMHAHVRKSVLTMPGTDPSACLITCGVGAEHDMTVATTKTYVDQFKELGAEIFIVDAGWVTPPDRQLEWKPFNGVNIPDPDRYPNGIAEVVDYCHAQGMKFSLWVEMERLGAYAPILKEHPEWLLSNVYKEGSVDGYLDMTNPEAAKWAEEEIARIITEYKIDMLRVDHNFKVQEYHAMKPHQSGTNEHIGLRQAQAVCSMYQNLKKRFPDVIFENCASGGARTDWAQLKAFNHTWVTDWQNNPRSLFITNGMTMALPPERVDRLCSGMGCHEFGSLDAHMRNTMFSHMTLNVIACPETFANPKQVEFIRRSVQLYKDFIRPFLPTAKIYHPTPDTAEAVQQGYTMLELTAEDQSRGIYGVFTLPGCGCREIRFTLKGVDLSRTYKVTLDNLGTSFEKTGAELYMDGLTVKVPASMSSELVLYEAI